MFSISDLAAFVAVADGGSVRHAATTLGRTQPAVTQAIQRLEHVVGFPLLDRSGYRAVPTERGQTFLKRARAVVLQSRELKAFASVLARDAEPGIRIAVHGATPPTVYDRLVGPIAHRFPDTVLEIESGEGNAPLRWLTEGVVDLAFALGSPPAEHALALERTRLCDVEFVNLAACCIEDDDALARLPQILVADFDEPAPGFGVVEGHRHWRVSNHPLKLDAIAAGSGWGTVPAWLAAPALGAGQVRTMSYRGIGPRSQHPLFCYRRREWPAGPVVSHIWAAAAE